MAFYQDMNGKTRKEKQAKAQARGGFDDEGSHYSDARGGAPRGRSQSSRSNGGRPSGQSTGSSRGPRSDAPRQGRPQGEGYGAPGQSRGPRSNAPRQGRPQGQGYGAPQGRGSHYDGPRQGRPQGEGYGAPQGRGPRSNAPRQGRPQGPGYGVPQGRAPRYEERPRFEQDSRPVSFRDRPRSAPVGERPPVDRDAPRDFRKSGNYRFSTGAPVRYSDRGSAVTPPSYDEQRRARVQDEPRYATSRYTGPAAYDVDLEGAEQELVPNENLLSGRNPIREALKSGRDIEKLMVARGELSGSAREIVAIAKERHIPVQEVDRSRLDDITHNHQGMLAFASAYQYSTLEAMLALAKERDQKPFLILLDGITDPHNLGAIIRTAECAGAHGVIVQERRAVGLTPAAVKASAGAIEHLPVARVTNLANTIEALKAQNIWVYAADMGGESYTKVNFDGAVALVIGAEGEGVGRRVAECCDQTVSIPLHGKLDSLNASVAAGILMYAVLNARG